jgi:hypothetical protein
LSSSEKAAKIVAASGLGSPVATSPAAAVEAPRNRDDLVAELASISDPREKADFFNRFEKILVGG